MNDTLPRLTEVLRSTFDDDTLVVTAATTAAEVPGWDSVMHITLLMACERAFSIRFRAGDVAGLKDIGELITLIDRLRTR